MRQKHIWIDTEDVIRLRQEQQLDAAGERESDAQTFKRLLDERDSARIPVEERLVLLRVDKKRI